MQKLIAIVGPTASGKSELAVRLAKKFKGEIISADSRQVYKNLNIGTGKVPGKWTRVRSPTSDIKVFISQRIPHHCIDFVNPKKQYSVAEYKKCADEAITDIASRGKIPILAGGTGLYIQAVVDDMDLPAVAPDKKLRANLKKKTPAQLFTMLKKIDPARAKNIDANNPRRLVRAIEIAKSLGRVPPLHLETKFPNKYDVLIIGLKSKPANIRSQGARMLKRGLLKEIKSLIKNGMPKKRIREMGFEYRYPLDYVEGKIESLTGLKNILTKENWRYAKRQMTWFKRDQRIHWVSNPAQAARLAQKFYTS